MVKKVLILFKLQYMFENYLLMLKEYPVDDYVENSSSFTVFSASWNFQLYWLYIYGL